MKVRYVCLVLIVGFLFIFFEEKKCEFFIENDILLFIMYFFNFDIILFRLKYIVKSILKINYDFVYKVL